jgi:SSS family solute:Na+ symporter
VPLRQTPFGPKRHIWFLRLSIMGVALFTFAFGSLFRQTDYLLMWWSITSAIFVGGAGAAIIGGLYWSKGTVEAAWAAMLTGSILGFGGILLEQLDPRFPFNGQEVSFAVSLLASAVYIGVSMLTCRQDFNMDRMLHRGVYATVARAVGDEVALSAARKETIVEKLIGIDDNFTRGDKWLAWSVFVWAILLFFVFLIATIWNLVAPWPLWAWSDYWLVSAICIPIFLTLVMAVWFTAGGLHDMRDFFRHLRTQKINTRDDGTVVDHQNLDENEAESRLAK